MKIPEHIAIIMDGNGRWAKKRGLPRTAGHRKGAVRIKEMVLAAKASRVKMLTVFAFSTENWKRPDSEVGFLFDLMAEFIKNYKKELMKENARFCMIGRRDRMPEKARRVVVEVEKATEKNSAVTLNVAVDYGGRWDIVDAARRMCRDFCDSKIAYEKIDEEVFAGYLSLGGKMCPDMLIRTSGEERISNFLLWDLAYSELYFPQVLWPDFDTQEFKKAIEVFNHRDRKFGAIKNA